MVSDRACYPEVVMVRSIYPVRKTTLTRQGDEDIAASRCNGAERMAMVWQLTCQAWMFKEGRFAEPRLRRDVVRVVRRGG